jgi:hypothetical protein
LSHHLGFYIQVQLLKRIINVINIKGLSNITIVIKINNSEPTIIVDSTGIKK